jgi:hypothetical protein
MYVPVPVVNNPSHMVQLHFQTTEVISSASLEIPWFGSRRAAIPDDITPSHKRLEMSGEELNLSDWKPGLQAEATFVRLFPHSSVLVGGPRYAILVSRMGN